ncbi:MAG: AAA family ATPase [Saprospiraceae bacterium]|nr:AAA family ATPase [Saprospiraceae bacterium]
MASSGSFTSALETILRSDHAAADRLQAMYSLLLDVCLDSVKESRMHLHTGFAVIAFAGHKHKIPGLILYNAHVFRKYAEAEKQKESDHAIQLGARVVADFLRLIVQARFSPSIHALLPSPEIYEQTEASPQGFAKNIRVAIVSNNIEDKILTGFRKDEPGNPIRIAYGLPDQDARYQEVMLTLEQTFQLPLEASLLDVEIDRDALLKPKAIVLDPDFLLDITAIAGCFDQHSISLYPFLLRKFLPRASSIPLMLGNVANYFLDELMANPTVSFRQLIRQTFRLDPLGLAQLNDADARRLVAAAEVHFRHLRKVVQQVFPKEGILPEFCYLEPSFYSEAHGLQGRLDVLYDHPKRPHEASIIELKSGKTYQPNAYGLTASHYVQTLLYDLMIRAASGGGLKPTNYILYSQSEEDQLRFAPAVRSLQYEALAVRNILLATDRALTRLDQDLDDFDAFRKLWAQKRRPTGFVRRDLDLLAHRFKHLSGLEKKFFMACTAFVAREHRLAKVGHAGGHEYGGQAALWTQAHAQKEDQYSILSGLSIVENNSNNADPDIVFERTERTNALANFRRGDLAVVYPDHGQGSPLHNQLIKGTITALDQSRVRIRLRARQFNQSFFLMHRFWNVEHDMLDSSFQGLYRSTYAFTGFTQDARSQYLGLTPPAAPTTADLELDDSCHVMTEEQRRIFHKMLQAEDYFFLWGPPGTGKTSIMLKHMVRYLFAHTRETIAVLAYTNRAVDEICAAFATLGNELAEQYVRIGSRHGCDPDYHEQLLDYKLRGVGTRRDLVQLIARHRLVVATVSSFMSKIEYLTMIKFDRVILDEATQVLEPTMAGLLPRFPKRLLIGDHHQLAAVVVQERSNSLITDSDLQEIGLHDLRVSFFERMLNRYRAHHWTWAYDQLTLQGRMHRELMEFPSQQFYGGTLQVMKGIARQEMPLPSMSSPGQLRDELILLLSEHRVIFLQVDSEALYRAKTNETEAQQVVRIISALRTLSHAQSASIGVITPFRAQIALIKQHLSEASLDEDGITVDTVERYQGGARDIIIISLCVTNAAQMQTLISKSSLGVDRKFNVALTRAREQMIVIGDASVVGVDPTYRKFVDRYHSKNLVRR